MRAFFLCTHIYVGINQLSGSELQGQRIKLRNGDTPLLPAEAHFLRSISLNLGHPKLRLWGTLTTYQVLLDQPMVSQVTKLTVSSLYASFSSLF